MNVERMSEAIEATAGVRLRPVYELSEEGEKAPDVEASSEMTEEDLIDMIKDKFDADEVTTDEVTTDEARESEAG